MQSESTEFLLLYFLFGDFFLFREDEYKLSAFKGNGDSSEDNFAFSVINSWWEFIFLFNNTKYIMMIEL